MMLCSVVCIFTPSHCCDVWYDVLFCRLYLHTFTLLWCRQNRTSYRTSQQCEGVKEQTTEQNSVSDILTVWRCEDTKTFTLLWCPMRCSVLSFVSSHLHTVVMSDTMFCSVVCITEHRIRHHNSVKVWRYKRQNRTSYRTSQQCEGVKIQTVCIFTPSHYCDVRYDVLFCLTVWRCEDTTTEQNIVSDITTVWRCEDTNNRT
jgi:hypothetical protein